MTTTRTPRGFTLIELLVAVTIIAILASIAYPSYTSSVAKSNRQAAKNVLHQIADRQEQFFLDNKRYSATLTGLGYPADTIVLDRSGDVVAASDPASIYQVRLVTPTPLGYTIAADPINAQHDRDSGCGVLALRHTGVKHSSGTADNCW